MKRMDGEKKKHNRIAIWTVLPQHEQNNTKVKLAVLDIFTLPQTKLPMLARFSDCFFSFFKKNIFMSMIIILKVFFFFFF